MTKNSAAPAANRSSNASCGIDLTKFLCTFLVIAIHFPPFSQVHFQSADTMNFVLSMVLARIAVPFFFMATGYFLLGSDNPDRVMGYCTKILRLCGIWSMILLLGSHGHLWYLKATVAAVIAVSVCLRWLKLPLVCVLGFGLYVIGLLGDSYYGFLEPLRRFGLVDTVIRIYDLRFGTTRNGFFMGFPFVLMGAWFARTGFTMRTSRAILGLVPTLALMVAEAAILKSHGICRDYNMYLLLLPASFFFFALAASLRLKPRPIYDHLRSIGALNYYTHIMVGHLLGYLFTALLRLTGIDLEPHSYLVVTAVTMLIATGIYQLSRKEKFTWLQYLYR